MIGSPRLLTTVFTAIAVLVTAGLFAAPDRGEEKGASGGPDVTVIYLGSIGNYGEDNGIHSFSVGTTSCNIGDKDLWWCNDAGDTFCHTNQHPVIAQNLYRLKEGRFEQIGMSWLKHGFLSTNSFDSNCGSCQGPPHGNDQLGIGCTDTYSSGLNGDRPLGLRSEVNATTGDFPYPYAVESIGSLIDQRIQVKDGELDPDQNPGARYWVEGHYIAADDAAAGNANNNASYREVNVQNVTFNLSLTGSTIRERAALYAWQAVDPEVEIVTADLPGATPERFHVARRITDTPEGAHYEYAVHNMSSDRSANSFTIQFPGTVEITGAGFRDVDHHSGEPYATTDWTIDVDDSTSTVSWFTDDFDIDPDANALRWGTMYTFWFDADVNSIAPVHTLGLFKPGSLSQLQVPLGAIFGDGFESGDTTAW